MALISNIIEARRMFSYPTQPPKLVRLVRWEAPFFDTYKINVDGSLHINSRDAGIGGLIRDSNGQLILGFSEHVRVEHIIHAELLAINKGLQLAWNVGCRKVICETDSTEALGLIEWANANHMYGEVIKEIQEIRKREWESIEFAHVLREGNQCADFLAKYGSKNQSNCMWSNPIPAALQIQLDNDAMGIFYFRSKL